MSVWVGGRFASQLISLTQADANEHTSKLYLMDIRLGLVVNVSDQAVACCSLWSPDGARIAFTGANGALFIWDMRRGDTTSLSLPYKAVSVDDWSSDSQALLVTTQRGDGSYQELYRVAVNGDGFQQLIASNDPFKHLNFVQESADDRFSVFVQGSSYITRLWEIYRIDADGKNRQQISDGEGVSYAPQLSPDGRRIVFTRGNVQNSHLFIMNADGSAMGQLTRTQTVERLPIWSPDGSQLLFQTYINPDFPRTLEIMNADGTGRRRLADDSAFDVLPSWSPDGQHIVYEIQRNGGTALYLTDADGTQVRLLLKNNWKYHLNPAWQPGM
ncbi:MAG: hypothetical protein ABI690_35115 [Chloroflexota bacterium]